MARTARNAKIDTRSARARLAVRREPYWCVISAGCAIGYRRGSKGSGTWIARLRASDGRQHHEALGAADDHRDADGSAVLSFSQAQERARSWFAAKARELNADPEDEPALASGEAYTVARCMADYLRWYKTHRKPGGYRFTATSAAAHILPALGEIDCAKLTARRIQRWHEGIAATSPMARTRAGAERAPRELGDDPEAVRKRRSTANRLLTILKAALSRAHAAGRIADDGAWRRVKAFRAVDGVRLRYLSDDQARRLVNGCDADFRPLVQAALFTGARYAELTRLRVADFNPDARTLTVRESKSGHPRHVVLTDEAAAFFAAATAGKADGTLMFAKPDGAAWGKSHQQRPLALACERTSIDPAISFHALRHTHASRLAMAGVPMMVIARQLGHRDARMAERVYAHLAPSYVAEAIRAGFAPLGIADAGTVTPLRQRVPA